jgi:methylglutaconyl-CoA hydratase
MKPYSTLQTSLDARGVAYVALNAPEKRNALSAEIIADLTALAADLGADPLVRVVVLLGVGRTFCAGGDLTWMQTQIAADRATRMAEATKLAHMLRDLNLMPKPLIGRIHGGALGGGVGLAAVCDCAIAADTTRFGLTETRLGLIPATISPYVIARMGEGAARQVFMSARLFDAADAQRLGLIVRAVPENQLDAAIEAEVQPYLSTAPGAVARAKALARSLGPKIDDAVLAATIQALADAWETDEARPGIAAFLDKTTPPWG